MRTLTDTLKAAQRVSPQVPAVGLLIRDKQPRVLHIGDESPGEDCQTDMVTADNGDLVAVKLDQDGNIKVKVISAFSTWGESGDWDDEWTLLDDEGSYPWHDTALSRSGDVVISNNSGVLRIITIKEGGDGVKCWDSDDNGATWGDEEEIYDSGVRRDNWWLCSAGYDDCWWTESANKKVYRKHKIDGDWPAGTQDFRNLESCSAWTNMGGLSVITVGDDDYVFVSQYSNGPTAARISVLKWGTAENANCGDFAGIYWKVMPPFRGTAPTGWCALWPKVIATDSGLGQSYLLSFLEKYTVGAEDMYNPVVLRSDDLDHWSDPVPLPFDTTYEHRHPMGVADDSVWFYIDDEAAEMRHYDAEDSRTLYTVNQSRVLRYNISETLDIGELVAEIDNRDGEFDSAGEAGAGAEAVRPLAQLVVDQGLTSSAGDERVESRPFYIWEVGRHRAPGANWLRIQAFDAWHLFRLWRPQATLVATSHTLKWCIEELACRVGFFDVEFDDDDDWDETLTTLQFDGDANDEDDRRRRRAWQRWVAMDAPEFIALDERTTGLSILRTLLSYVGGVARWGNADDPDVLYCFIPKEQGDDPAAAHTYDDGEVLEGLYAAAVQWPSRARCTGGSGAAEARDRLAGATNGREIVTFLTDAGVSGADWCEVVAESALDDGSARSESGYIVTRPNVGLELLDIIALSDSKVGAAGLSSVKRRVNELTTEYDPLNEVWQQRVGLEHV